MHSRFCVYIAVIYDCWRFFQFKHKKGTQVHIYVESPEKISYICLNIAQYKTSFNRRLDIINARKIISHIPERKTISLSSQQSHF